MTQNVSRNVRQKFTVVGYKEKIELKKHTANIARFNIAKVI